MFQLFFLTDQNSSLNLFIDSKTVKRIVYAIK